MSVPHSGTRTLVEHLGLRAADQRLRGGRWWHFGYPEHEKYLRYYKTVHLHIPVRNPLDVAKSWARQEKNIHRLLEAYESMFTNGLNREHTLHQVELLPRLAGANDSPEMTGNPVKIQDYQDIILYYVVRPHESFFRRFYPEL